MLKKIFGLLVLFAMLAACQAVPVTVSATPTFVVKQTDRPGLTPFISQTPTPTPTQYPTAGTIQANSVAFIADNQLWVANVDGSGERKLADIKTNSEQHGSYALGRSPDGKWISYISADELWVVSLQSLVAKKLLAFPPEKEERLFKYVWSPDGSKIALANISTSRPVETATPGPEARAVINIKLKVIDVVTENVTAETSFNKAAFYFLPLTWSPDGRYLMISSMLLNAITLKEIKKVGGGPCMGRDVVWSPNSKYFFDTDHGNGRYTSQWICMNSVNNGASDEVNAEGTTSKPVWDKTGNFIYFVARQTNPNSDPKLNVDHRLMRYDVRTKELKRILSLTNPYVAFAWSISISPDRQTIKIDTATTADQQTIIFVDTVSLTSTTLNIKQPPHTDSEYDLATRWTADNQNLIFVLPTADGQYRTFYRLNKKTGQTAIISGIHHHIEGFAVSPMDIFP